MDLDKISDLPEFQDENLDSAIVKFFNRIDGRECVFSNKPGYESAYPSLEYIKDALHEYFLGTKHDKKTENQIFIGIRKNKKRREAYFTAGKYYFDTTIEKALSEQGIHLTDEVKTVRTNNFWINCIIPDMFMKFLSKDALYQQLESRIQKLSDPKQEVSEDDIIEYNKLCDSIHKFEKRKQDTEISAKRAGVDIERLRSLYKTERSSSKLTLGRYKRKYLERQIAIAEIEIPICLGLVKLGYKFNDLYA